MFVDDNTILFCDREFASSALITWGALFCLSIEVSLKKHLSRRPPVPSSLSCQGDSVVELVVDEIVMLEVLENDGRRV